MYDVIRNKLDHSDLQILQTASGCNESCLILPKDQECRWPLRESIIRWYGYATSPKFLWPVSLACCCAAVCPFSLILHSLHMSVNFCTSVNWRLDLASLASSAASSNILSSSVGKIVWMLPPWRVVEEVYYVKDNEARKTGIECWQSVNAISLCWLNQECRLYNYIKCVIVVSTILVLSIVDRYSRMTILSINNKLISVNSISRGISTYKKKSVRYSKTHVERFEVQWIIVNSIEYQKDPLRVMLIFTKPIDNRVDAVDHRYL